MLKQLLQIPYIKDLVKRLGRDTYLREKCGYRDKTHTEAHAHAAAEDLVQAASVDGTDLPTWSSRDPHNTRHGLGDP